MRFLLYGIVIFFVCITGLLSCQDNSPKATLQNTFVEDSCDYTYDTAYADWLTLKANKIDSFFSDREQKRQFNGTILFADQGNVIIKKAYGYANIKKRDSLQLNSAFQLASISKPLTALAILWLEDRGYLSLRDSIQRFFPKFPYKNINVELLLTHRSGLPNYMYFAEEHWRDRDIPISNQDVVCMMQTYQPNIYYIPDYRYNYSNTNYALLSAIVEKVSGLSYGDFMDYYIFDPLGMYHTFVYTKLEAKASELSTVGFHRGRIAEDTYLNGVTGDKGIYSTVEDLFKLDQALYSDSFLKKKSLDRAFTAANPELYDHDNYGLGWRINQRPDCSKVIFHSGWWKGYRTHFFRLIDEKQTIIVLSNTNRSRFINTRSLLDLMES